MHNEWVEFTLETIDTYIKQCMLDYNNADYERMLSNLEAIRHYSYQVMKEIESDLKEGK